MNYSSQNQYEFEELVKKHIKDSGRTQASTARILGYPRDTFNKWIRGVNQIPFDVIHELCKLWDLSPVEQGKFYELAGYQLPNRKTQRAPHEIFFQLTPRLPCLLLLDISSSMTGAPIQALSNGLKSFVNDLINNPTTSNRVELALITFGSVVDVVRDFSPAYEFIVPDLNAHGATAMGTAVELGLDLIDKRKLDYKNQGIPYYQPMVLLFTDGYPSDNWQTPVNRLHKECALRNIRFIAVGLESADMSFLNRIAPPGTKPVLLKELRFSEMFHWLSSSMDTVSLSDPNEYVDLPDPSKWTKGFNDFINN